MKPKLKRLTRCFTDKRLDRLKKKKKTKRADANKIRKKSGDITTNLTEIKKIRIV